MKKAFVFLLLLGCCMAEGRAQWLDFSSNNGKASIGFHVGKSALGTPYAEWGLGASLQVYGVYVDFLSIVPAHKYDNHITQAQYQDSASFAINAGYQVPVLPWLRVMPLVGYCQTNYGTTDGTSVNVDHSETSSSLYHDYTVASGSRKHYFNYGVGLFVQPLRWFDIYGIASRLAIYGGFSIHLDAFRKGME